MSAPYPPMRRIQTRLGAIIPVLIATVAASTACLDLSDPYVHPTGGTTPPTEGYRCFAPLDGDDDSLRIHFIDVGQGDAIWIQTPDDGSDGNGEKEGYNIIVDTGRTPIQEDPSGTGQVIIDYLASRGELEGATIDFLIITHAHADHYGGAIELMDAYDVINILDPGFDNQSNSTYVAYLSRAQAEVAENGGQLYRPLVGTLVSAEYEEIDIFGDEITTHVLNSEANLRQGDDLSAQLNNTSIALSMEYGGVEVLLMGDCEAVVEADIIDAMPDLRGNILKVGHHGSSSSSSEAFLEHIFDNVPITRRFAVISAGRRSFGGTQHPEPAIVQRLLEYVPPESFFTTELDDEGKTEAEAPGDDHIQAVITADGQVDMCYAPTPATGEQ